MAVPKQIGFLVNPIAGMGGSVGLKGTDGTEILQEAVKRGAEPQSNHRAEKTLKGLAEYLTHLNKVEVSQANADKSRDRFKFITCTGGMGEDALESAGFVGGKDYQIVYSTSINNMSNLSKSIERGKTPSQTTFQDTLSACNSFLECPDELFLILFCGGDGTARDIYSVVNGRVPILGIPAGVKMHSAVFAINPISAAVLLVRFLRDEISVRDAEVMDLDEELYRQDRLDVKLFGYARTPYEQTLVQTRKFVYQTEDEEDSKDAIARYLIEIMNEPSGTDTIYVIGAGTTTDKIMRSLELDGTLLGVDVVKNGSLLAKDVNEQELLGILGGNRNSVKIIVTPIGAQGFVFGRGTQQLSAKILNMVGVDNIMIISTPYKLSQTPVLRVDTGNDELDRELTGSGYTKIITGYHNMRMTKIEGTIEGTRTT